MNKELFFELIVSYNFTEKRLSKDEKKTAFKCFELTFEPTDSQPDLTLYWYKNNMFSLYRNEGFATTKIFTSLLNLYNLKLAIENNIPTKNLEKLTSEEM